MQRRTRWIAAAGLAVALAAVDAAAATDGDSDRELPGSTRDRATVSSTRDSSCGAIALPPTGCQRRAAE